MKFHHFGVHTTEVFISNGHVREHIPIGRSMYSELERSLLAQDEKIDKLTHANLMVHEEICKPEYLVVVSMWIISAMQTIKASQEIKLGTLKSGSSQHGKHLRASAGSKTVTAMFFGTPPVW